MANTLRDNLRDLMIEYHDIMILRQHNIENKVVTDYTEMTPEEIYEELLTDFFEAESK